jgi:hypothetical protein
MARAFSTNHFPAFCSNLFVFEKKKQKGFSLQSGLKNQGLGYQKHP